MLSLRAGASPPESAQTNCGSVKPVVRAVVLSNAWSQFRDKTDQPVSNSPAYPLNSKHLRPSASPHPIDAFIAAKLVEKNLSPSPKPTRTLIRRLIFDAAHSPAGLAETLHPTSWT